MIGGVLCVVLLLVVVGIVWDVAARGIGGKDQPETAIQPAGPYHTFRRPRSLETWIQPIQYNLSIYLQSKHFVYKNNSFGENQFYGEVRIQLQVQQTTQMVALDSMDMSYDEIILYLPDEKRAECICGESDGCRFSTCQGNSKAVFIIPEQNIVVLDLGTENALKRDKDQWLFIKYKAVFDDQEQVGLYRSEPFAVADEQHEAMIVTQMGPPNMLPCFNDMALKAKFTVEVFVEDRLDLDVMSSMELESKTSYNDFQGYRYRFATSPKMSLYLLAIAVGQFDYQTGNTLSGKNVTVASALHRSYSSTKGYSLLDVPLQFAISALEFYEEWTQFEQPLQKFDLIAVPGKQFSMENWGLLMYDEKRFFVDEALDDAYKRWRSADIVCHEVAHQWFGNLITMTTVMDMTVNEGLASYMENKCISYVLGLSQNTERILRMFVANPGWEIAGSHEGPFANALRVAADPFYGPLWPLPKSPSVYFYSTGAAVYSMLEMIMDYYQQDGMKIALQDVLNTYQYQSCSILDLVQILSQHFQEAYNSTDFMPDNLSQYNASVSSYPLNEFGQAIMTWFHNTGLPEVTFSYEFKNGEPQLTNISQTKRCNFGIVQDDESIICEDKLDLSNYDTSTEDLYYKQPQQPWWLHVSLGKFLDSDDYNDTYSYIQNMDIFAQKLKLSQTTQLQSQSQMETSFPRAQSSAGLFYGVYNQEFITYQLSMLENTDMFYGECSPSDYSNDQINQLAQIGQFLLDLQYSAFSVFPQYKNQFIGILQAMEAVGKSEDLLCTGIGTYVAMVPLIESIIQFETYLQDNEQCLQNFRNWANEKLISKVISTFDSNITINKSQYMVAGQLPGSSIDDFFGYLIRPYIVYTAIRFQNIQLKNQLLDAYEKCEVLQQCNLNPDYIQAIYMTKVKFDESQQNWNYFYTSWKDTVKENNSSDIYKSHRMLVAMTQAKESYLKQVLQDIINGGNTGGVVYSDSDSAWVLAARSQPWLVLDTVLKFSSSEVKSVPFEDIVSISVSSNKQHQDVVAAMQKWEWPKRKTLKIRSIMASRLQWISDNVQDLCDYVRQ
eukprot:TRINITY_DN8936_c0_g1_i3.p1 TRINITY_DN8936_c0_g1~~TRINITY_DN8936_c0_g1_i3.p1  ORF type:complete len:1062 (-),score=95.45 TRINITY_DN8936_c0_g1_i3:302-3487(-)